MKFKKFAFKIIVSDFFFQKTSPLKLEFHEKCLVVLLKKWNVSIKLFSIVLYKTH